MKQAFQRGFTIVELLIVIVVIGILAAIVIVTYNGIQGRAYDVPLQSDMNGIAKQLALYQADKGSGKYPTTLSTEMVEGMAGKLRVSKGSYKTSINNFLYCKSSDGSDWGIVAVSKSGKVYAATSRFNAKEYSGAGVNNTTGTLGSQSDICPALVPGAPATTHAWGFSPSTGWDNSWIIS